MSVTASPLVQPRPARRAIVAVIALGAALLLPGAASAAKPVSQQVATPAGRPTIAAQSDATRRADRLLVTYKHGTSAATRATIRGAAKATLVSRLKLVDADVIRPSGSLDAAMAALRADPRVDRVEVDAPLSADSDPTLEPEFTHQWGLENDASWAFGGVVSVADVDIDAAAAWPTATGAGVTVAVIDTGVDFAHPDLAGQQWVNPGESGGGKETNGVDDDGNGYVDDVNGVNVCGDAPASTLYVEHGFEDKHGTAVASVVAAAANGVGMTGVAPDARIMGIRFLVNPGATVGDLDCRFESWAIDAIDYAIDNGAKIINASWGGPGNSFLLREAVSRANEAGVLFVAAAGNGDPGTGTPHYPAAFDLPNILSVGSIDPDGAASGFSMYGSWVDMAAPGGSILAAIASPGGPNPWGYWDGTSFSAPHVAGAAALVAQAQPSLLGDAAGLRAKLIFSGWRADPDTATKTASGRVLDAFYALDFTPPVQPTPLLADVKTGTQLGSLTAIAHLVWPNASDANGIDSYRVRYRYSTSSAWTWATSGTTNRYTFPKLRTGVTYIVEVRARDRGGNETAMSMSVKLSRTEESSASIHYAGTWKTVKSSSASGGATRYATKAGASATYSFNGRGIAFVGPRSRTGGTAKLYVDGAYVKTISLYASSTLPRSVLYSQAWGAKGAHTIKLVLNGPASRPRFDVDTFVVTP